MCKKPQYSQRISHLPVRASGRGDAGRLAVWQDANRRLARRRYVEHAIPAQGCQRAAHCGRSASVLRVVLKKDVNGGNHTTAAEHAGQA